MEQEDFLTEEEVSMRYALSLPNGGECSDPRILADLAALAEETGWDGVFLEDYIVYTNATYFSVPGSPTHDPWVALAAMALRTQRIRLGTAVTPLPRRRPWKLAREAVSIDHLSNGRLVLGVGLGDVGEPGFARFGETVDARQRAELVDESLDILAGLWSGEPFSYRGKHYTVNEVTFLPRPVQSPRIPIWVGGGWPMKGPVQRAARWDGAMLYKQPADGTWQDMMPEDIRALKATVEHQRAASTPYDIVTGGRERRDDWDVERSQISALAEAGATWWSEWVPAASLATMRAAIQRGPLRVA
jgi:alkanesulfonate monooxygenase SsuD/methylene tetrahydromethanopterin reductase-like flavin-dependent oxidoreductase (luciferase family)